MPIAECQFRVGQYVRLVSPAKIDTVIGRIMAIEEYTDFHGTRRWLYVAWYTPSGYRGEPEKHSEAELIHEDQEL